MKPSPVSRLSTEYLAGLRAHLRQDRRAAQPCPPAAQDLGCDAVILGLETLDLAKIHESALASLLLAAPAAEPARLDLTGRAEAFFTEAIVPIERNHHSARDANVNLDEVLATLEQRTADLALCQSELKCEILARTHAETILRDSKRDSLRLLKDSRALEQQLQGMARQILSATEAERSKLSLQLNHDIAQTLLGIHIRMVALQQEVATHCGGIPDKIAAIQRLVQQSMKVIAQLTHEFGSPTQC